MPMPHETSSQSSAVGVASMLPRRRSESSPCAHNASDGRIEGVRVEHRRPERRERDAAHEELAVRQLEDEATHQIETVVGGKTVDLEFAVGRDVATAPAVISSSAKHERR